MSHSETIAAIVGPVLLASGVSIILNREQLQTLATQVSTDYALIFLSGFMLLAVGVAIVRVHNVWAGDWRVVVTVIGWVAIVSGLVRLLFFSQLANLAPSVMQWRPWLPVAAAITIVIGGFLTFKGFRRTEHLI